MSDSAPALPCPDENTLVAFASGALAMVDAARVEEHLDGCGVCFSLVAELARADPAESDPTRMLPLFTDEADGDDTDAGGSQVRLWGLGRRADPGQDDDEGERTLLGPLMPPAAPPSPASPPTQLGRYTILHRLGAGAMGVVYAAVDRELGRRVALKLIEATGPDAIERGARLLREAQALARLAHPNVVTVFDAGRVDGQVFVSMELVTGATLRDWLQVPEGSEVATRSWREVLFVFRQAGAGLAAAHAAGIIHRDFKPSNVLVDEQVRARVVDFGLARAFGPARDDAQTVIRASPISIASADGGRPGSEVSRSDVVAGTPAYMAPEQYEGLGDARIDEFAFCVAFYEALYGRRPFEGRDAEQLQARINTGMPPDIPLRSDVPDWLAQIVIRGLARDPDRRFPSMQHLLDAIERAQHRGIVRRRLAMGGAAAACGIVIVAAIVAHEQPHPCDDARARLAGTWDDATRAALATKIATVGAPFGTDGWNSAHGVVDRWTEQWIDATSAECRAREAAPDAVGRAQRACLDRGLVGLRALAAIWAAADRPVVEHLVEGALWLPPVAACAEAPEFFDPEIFVPDRRILAQRIRDDLVAVRVAANAGSRGPGADLGQATLELARGLGDDHPLVGAAHLALGELLIDDGRALLGVTHVDAALQASITRDDAEMLSRAAAAAARGAVAAHREAGAVLQLVAIGRAALGRAAATGDREDAAVQLDLAEAAALVASGRANLAIAPLTAALERSIARHGEQDLRVADIAAELGRTSIAALRLDEALVHQRRALSIREGLQGGAHPAVAASCAAVADALIALGRIDEARELSERALSIQERAFGSQDAHVAAALGQLGAIEAELGHIDLALASHRRALEIRERSADVAQLAIALDRLGATLVTLGRWDEADSVLHRALDLGTTKLGADPLEVATTHFLLGRTAHGRGDFPRAVAEFTAAYETRRMLGAGEVSTAITQTWLARAQRDGGDLEHAQTTATDALDHLDPLIEPDAWAHARLVVADAQWSHGDGELALAGVTQAISTLRASPVPPTAVAMLEAWQHARSNADVITIDP